MIVTATCTGCSREVRAALAKAVVRFAKHRKCQYCGAAMALPPELETALASAPPPAPGRDIRQAVPCPCCEKPTPVRGNTGAPIAVRCQLCEAAFAFWQGAATFRPERPLPAAAPLDVEGLRRHGDAGAFIADALAARHARGELGEDEPTLFAARLRRLAAATPTGDVPVLSADVDDARRFLATIVFRASLFHMTAGPRAPELVLRTLGAAPWSVDTGVAIATGVDAASEAMENYRDFNFLRPDHYRPHQPINADALGDGPAVSETQIRIEVLDDGSRCRLTLRARDAKARETALPEAAHRQLAAHLAGVGPALERYLMTSALFGPGVEGKPMLRLTAPAILQQLARLGGPLAAQTYQIPGRLQLPDVTFAL